MQSSEIEWKITGSPSKLNDGEEERLTLTIYLTLPSGRNLHPLSS